MAMSQIQADLRDLAHKYLDLYLNARQEAHHVYEANRKRGWRDVFLREAMCYKLILADLEEILTKFAPSEKGEEEEAEDG